MENYNAILEERRKWKKKFDNATEEEQAQMLAERAEAREREKAEREQKMYAERKERFMKRAENEILATEYIIKARQIALDMLKDFDGKVLNNRYTKAVDAKLKEVYRGLWCTLVVEYDHTTKANVGRLKIEVRLYEKSNGTDNCTIYIKLLPDLYAYRVDYAKTIEDSRNTNEGELKQIEDYKNAIKQYDKVYKHAEKVRKTIEDYAKNNYYLRDYFRAERVISNVYYL